MVSTNTKKKVYVGMSGGVDSSLSAALLKEQGYDVTGVFIKVWQPDFIECTWREDRRDAMRVASELDIAFITLDLEKEYKKGVIDYMFEEYRSGRTPNPDVMCNREVKFGAFWNWVKARGEEAYIATGHYAVTDGTHLFTSKDVNKDQTYFLWTLTKDDLAHVLFPIGHMTKDEVRKEAEKRKLFTSAKKDSQGLCFVGTIDIKTLLKEYIDEKQGEVKNENGEVIGIHDGVMFYTIGERHGFTITKKDAHTAAYYVVKKDIQTNTLYVASIPPETKREHEISLEKVSWVNTTPDEHTIYEARARYRAPLVKVKVSKKENVWSVIPQEEGLVVVDGQSLVIYKDGECIGGGVIRQ